MERVQRQYKKKSIAVHSVKIVNIRDGNKIQTAAISIINLRILYNLTFRMLVNIHFQK